MPMPNPRFESGCNGRRFAGVVCSMLLLSALVLLGGSTGCETEPCTPDHPDYDPETMTCPDQDDRVLGPPVFGTGGLPTEPGTDTPEPDDPDHDPDAVDVDIYGLNGRWIDSGRDVCIQHTGSGVVAWYVELRECDHADGTGNVSVTYEDFEGDLVGNTITGMLAACRFGHDEPSENGIVHTSFTLTVSADGKTLSGTWFNSDEGQDIPFEVTRETVGNCQAPD
jgi:hypothetical protein